MNRSRHEIICFGGSSWKDHTPFFECRWHPISTGEWEQLYQKLTVSPGILRDTSDYNLNSGYVNWVITPSVHAPFLKPYWLRAMIWCFVQYFIMSVFNLDSRGFSSRSRTSAFSTRGTIPRTNPDKRSLTFRLPVETIVLALISPLFINKNVKIYPKKKYVHNFELYIVMK